MVWVVLVAGLLFFTALGNHQLQGSTEPRVGGIAMEMYLLDDWVIPRLNGQPFLEKPPLSLWLDAAALHVFGATAWSVRLTSALAGLLSVALLFGMLRAWSRPRWTAIGAALMLATTASYWANVRQVGEDSLLTLGVSLALLTYFNITRQPPATFPRQCLRWLPFAVAIAIATTSKGVLGLALPGVVIFAWLLVNSLRARAFRPSLWSWPACGALLGLLPLAVWLVFLYRAAGVDAVAAVLWTNSMGRFSGSFADAGHFEPFYYYLGKLPEAFLPWNILVYPGLWHFRKQLVKRPDLLFFTVWLVAQFSLLTLASSKRMVYLMALTPAAAVIAAEYARVCLARMGQVGQTHRWARALEARRPLLLGALMGVIICGYLAVAIVVQPRDDRQQSFLPLAQRISALQVQGNQVVLFNPSERLAGAGVFYSRSLLQAMDTEQQLNEFLDASAHHVALMERENEPSAPLRILDKQVVGDRAYYFVTH